MNNKFDKKEQQNDIKSFIREIEQETYTYYDKDLLIKYLKELDSFIGLKEEKIKIVYSWQKKNQEQLILKTLR